MPLSSRTFYTKSAHALHQIRAVRSIKSSHAQNQITPVHSPSFRQCRIAYGETSTTRLQLTPHIAKPKARDASFQPGRTPCCSNLGSTHNKSTRNTQTTPPPSTDKKNYSLSSPLSLCYLFCLITMPPTLSYALVLLLLFAAAYFPATGNSGELPTFREAPAFRNGRECQRTAWSFADKRAHSPSVIHIAMTLDATYLRGSVAGVFSVLQHASCPENVVFHFIATTHRRPELRRIITATFPYLNFHLYHFDSNLVKGKISYSIRRALDQPLNYARMYLADLLPATVRRIIYFDSDLIVVDDVAKLWSIDLGARVLGAPEYCHANFTNYFTHRFWSSPAYAASFRRRDACYFNTGVMVIDLRKWREGRYTEKLENWMRIQKRNRIYELGSLPPFLLVFAGNVERVEHRWNQHGLGGDNLEGLCRDLHPGPVSLLHWSGKGKPWLRIDAKKPCPLDSLWVPYDLFRHSSPSSSLFSDS